MANMTDEIPSGEYKQRCSECDQVTSRVSNYCPRCGVELEKGDNTFNQ